MKQTIDALSAGGARRAGLRQRAQSSEAGQARAASFAPELVLPEQS
jgi:hypothetical protein